MAQPYSHGAVHLWVSIRFSNPFYLGTCERAPRVSRTRKHRDLLNDLGGDEAFDAAYMGSGAFVTAKLTRWNERTLLMIENSAFPNTLLDVGGTDTIGEIGTLMVTEGQALQLWVQYSYAQGQLAPKAAYNNPISGAMRAGYHFLNAFLDSPDDHDGGTDPATEAIVFRCMRGYNPTTGTLTLYDRDMSGINALLPN